MYTVGLLPAAEAFLALGIASHFFFIVVILLVFLRLGAAIQEVQCDVPVTLSKVSYFNVWPFFRRRFDFLNWGFRSTGESIFQFNLLWHKVIAVSGEEGRKAFFSAKDFNLNEGFQVLAGAIPMMQGVTTGIHSRRITLIHKRLLSIQRNESLSDFIPAILEDCRRFMGTWGYSGTFDPFERIHELTFQTTVRCLSCTDIADDTLLVARLKQLYDTLDVATTPMTVLLPWFPTPTMIKRLWATKEIYQIIIRAINAREQSGISKKDTLQVLLDAGDDKMAIVGFIMGLLIAGARSTGTTTSWLITFIGGHPEWRGKAITEVESLLAAHSSYLEDTSQSLATSLSTIPLDAWESDTPVLDCLIRETLRMAEPHVAMRRNMGPDVYLQGKLVPTGAFIVYPFSDVHLNPELYPEPWKFDPLRHSKNSKVALGYLGWGGGRTTCLGMRLAKVEMKLIAAMFLLGYRFEMVGKTGKPSDPLPRPNWNDSLKCRPSAGSCYLKYERAGTRAL